MSAAAAKLQPLRALAAQAMVADAQWAFKQIARAEQRLNRGQAADRLIIDIHARLSASVKLVNNRQSSSLTISYPDNLPVAQRRDDILTVLKSHRVMVLTGETGSGKTTQLPKLLWEAGYGRRGMIAMTQPRRVAAIAMATRIREEMCASTNVINHSVRFDDRATSETILRVMTDGLLLAEAVNDPDFEKYDAIIIDEAHERSLNIDLLLGLLQMVRKRRLDLAIIISSASIAAERFAEYYTQSPAESVPIIAVAGRTFPVDIHHQPPGDDDIGYLAAAISSIKNIHHTNESGDILCFLPTERDILEARRRLHDIAGLIPVPLFSRLTPHEQQRVFASLPGRKVVLATNIAETSLTIPGIRYVVDTGLARLKRYQASSRTERLPIEAVSQASCLQRAGRAGRIEAGMCIRLFSAEAFTLRDEFTSPEILRSNLAGVLLSCLSLGLGDPAHFPWLDAPSPHAWQQARLLLDELGAFASSAQTTSAEKAATHSEVQLSLRGRQIAAIPADPQVARILLSGITEKVPHEACTIAAFLSVQDPRVRPVGQEAKADAAHKIFIHEAGDLASILKLWTAYQNAPSNSARSRLCEHHFLGYRRMREWSDVRHQLWQALRDTTRGGAQLPAHGFAPDAWPLDRIHRAVLAGMLGNVLLYDREERCYRGAGDRRLHVHPGSALKSGKVDDGKRAQPPPPWLVACEVVETSRLFARLCAPIDPNWVIELAGDRVKRRYYDPHWHAARKQVVCRETILWKSLPLSTGRLIPYERVDGTDATRIFIEQALVMFNDDEQFERQFPIITINRQTIAIARGLRDRLRDPALYIDDSHLITWYSERLQASEQKSAVIASTDALRRWIATHGVEQLRIRLTDLCHHEQAVDADRLAPLVIAMGKARLPIKYCFAPGDDADGATLTLGESQIGLIDAERLDWLVPAWLSETITAYIQQLPKDIRRKLIPISETVSAFLSTLTPQTETGSLAVKLASWLSQRLDDRCPALDSAALPPYLRIRFVIYGVDRSVIYAGRDPRFLAAQMAAAGDRLRVVRAQWETAPSLTWPGDCPISVKEMGVSGYIALVRSRDHQGQVAVHRAVFASVEAAATWHEDGLDAALEAAHNDALTQLATATTSATHAARIEKIIGVRLGLLRRHLGLAIITSVQRSTVRDEKSFLDLLTQSQAALSQATLSHANNIDSLIDPVAKKLESLRNRLKQGAKSLAMATVLRSVAQHLELLCAPGWSTRLPWSALQRLPHYLDGLLRRLDDATTRPQDALRSSERISSILLSWQEMQESDARLIMACGLTRTVRELVTVREETILGIVTGGGNGAGFAEGRLRDGVHQVTQRLQAEQRLIKHSREKALDIRSALQRLPAGARRDALMAEGDQIIAAYPDLSFMADIIASRATVEAWCERAQLALRV